MQATALGGGLTDQAIAQGKFTRFGGDVGRERADAAEAGVAFVGEIEGAIEQVQVLREP